MKFVIPKSILFFLIVATSLVGVSSCTNTNASKSSNETQRELKIGGSSSSYFALKNLTDVYNAKKKDTQVTFSPESQSEAAIAGVKQGIFDVGSISKTLKPEDNDGTLEYREVAKDGLLVATHLSVKNVKNLTTDNLKDIYSGKVKNWKELGGSDDKIVLLDRPEDESAKKLLLKYYLGDNLTNSSEAVVLRKESDLIAAIQNTPNSIGAFSLASTISNKLPVNRLSLNGVEPTPENVRAEKYKMVRAIGIVFKKTPKPETKELVDFVSSKEAAGLLSKSGFVPSN
jgi:phosphate transport system substrate-binding protein